VTVTISDITESHIAELQKRLDEYDFQHSPWNPEDEDHVVRIGLVGDDGELFGGAEARTVDGDTLHVDMLFIDEKYRGCGCGKKLLTELESRAKELGIFFIRVDTFGFQAPSFYEACGYTQVGEFTHPTSGYQYHFFAKHLTD